VSAAVGKEKDIVKKIKKHNKRAGWFLQLYFLVDVNNNQTTKEGKRARHV
jgi:hypothetical protein